MKRILVITLFILFVVQFLFLSSSVQAQFQETPFSANDQQCNSYRCPEREGTSPTPSYNVASEFCECTYPNGDTIIAFVDPPALQQLEIWFVRIVYAIWAFVGSLSFLLLVYLGYQYILTRGDVTKITEIRQRIINYGIGTVLVFLAVPLLGTFFRLLGLNAEVECYNFETLPRFQFFFPTLCTESDVNRILSFCDSTSGFDDVSDGRLACPTPNTRLDCPYDSAGNDTGSGGYNAFGDRMYFLCSNESVWVVVAP